MPVTVPNQIRCWLPRSNGYAIQCLSVAKLRTAAEIKATQVIAMLLVAPGLTTRNEKLLVTRGIATSKRTPKTHTVLRQLPKDDSET